MNAQTTTDAPAPRLAVERLEGRDLPTANYFILDFTPDYHTGSFAQTFSMRDSRGYAPGFLDMNRDGYVNATDVPIAAKAIADRVATYYAPFLNNRSNNLQILYGDVTSQSNWGFRWIQYGSKSNAVEVAVMYFGGTSRYGQGTAGVAPLAGEGENIEGYGETYTRSIAATLAGRGNATPADFVNRVAAAAAHELGHMMGLRHSTSRGFDSLMNPTLSNDPNRSSFIRGGLYTEGGPVQDAFAELDYSFQMNQRQVLAPNYALGGQAVLDTHGSGCHHEIPGTAPRFHRAAAALPPETHSPLNGVGRTTGRA